MKCKKLLALLLALLLAFALVACGDTADAGDDTDDLQAEDTDDTAGTDDTADTAGAEGQSLLEILKDRFIAAPELNGTNWTFIGGYVNGVQMTEDQTQEVMSQLGDVYQFAFTDDSTAVLAEGEDQTEGTYTVGEDGLTVKIEVGGTTYGGTFIQQEDGCVMVALLDSSGMNALYFHQIIEG